jgi:hypothetical protein
MKPKPPPHAIRSVRNRAKRCYELAGKAVIGAWRGGSIGNLVMIHGYYLEPIPFEHAWVLDVADSTVFDTARWEWCAVADYPGIEHIRYTRDQLREKILQHGFWGMYPEDWPDFEAVRAAAWAARATNFLQEPN